MRYRTNNRAYRSDKLSFWQSYSDVIAALLLTFILILAGTLLEARKTYERKQDELNKKELIIVSQKKQIDKIIGVQEKLITALKKEFSNKDLAVSVDQNTGAITFESRLLFAHDKAILQKHGKEELDKFLPSYLSVILSKEFSQYIAEIIVEGHTDSTGEYMYNLRLSQNRAFAVASYCLTNKKKLLTKAQQSKLRNLMTANGRSCSNLKYKYKYDKYGTERAVEDKEASRRVEIKFRLREDEMMEQITDILGKSK